MNVLIAGNWAPNKGDRAVLTFIIEQLMSRSDIQKIYVSTTDPAYYDGNLSFGEKVKFVPFGYNLQVKQENNLINKIIARIRRIIYFKVKFPTLIRSVLKKTATKINSLGNSVFLEALNDSDLVIVTGGHHITSMREEDSLHSITYDLGLINLSGKKYVLWAQTIGPLDFKKEINKKYIYTLLSDARAICLRDGNSHDVINKLGFKLNNIVDTYDSVFGLYKSNCKNYVCKKDENTVGMSIFYANFKTSEEINNYVQTMANICEYLISKNYKIKFFPMETDQKEISIINSITKNVKAKNVSIVDTNIPSNQHILEVNKCELFIGHKTHSVIFSLITNTPLIALCYHRKTKDFMKMYNLEDYAILDENFDINHFKKLFTELESNKEEIRVQMDKCNKKFAEKVIDDFNSIVD